MLRTTSSELVLFGDSNSSETSKGEKQLVLETTFNEVGHTDLQEEQPEDADDVEDVVMLPLVVFKVTKTITLPTSISSTMKGAFGDKTHFTFPTNRLLDGFVQVTSKIADPQSILNLHKPDLLSVLTAALLLKSDEIISACARELDNDRLVITEFIRAWKLAQKWRSCIVFVDSLFLYALRHSERLTLDPQCSSWEDDSLFDDAAKRVQQQNHHLFLSYPLTVDLTTISGGADSGASKKSKGYDNLEKHVFQRIEVGNERHFLLIRDRDNAVLCYARLTESKDAFIFFDRYTGGDLRVNSQHYCGVVEASFLGETWVLYDAGGNKRRQPQGRIVYHPNALGRVPNSLKVHLPLTVGGSLHTRQPRWHDSRGWSLDFRQRVRIPSKKNFLLVLDSDNNDDDNNIVLLFGKFSKHIFSLDIAPPVSPLLGFAVALTTFADKLVVT